MSPEVVSAQGIIQARSTPAPVILKHAQHQLCSPQAILQNSTVICFCPQSNRRATAELASEQTGIRQIQRPTTSLTFNGGVWHKLDAIEFDHTIYLTVKFLNMVRFTASVLIFSRYSANHLVIFQSLHPSVVCGFLGCARLRSHSEACVTCLPLWNTSAPLHLSPVFFSPCHAMRPQQPAAKPAILFFMHTSYSLSLFPRLPLSLSLCPPLRFSLYPPISLPLPVSLSLYPFSISLCSSLSVLPLSFSLHHHHLIWAWRAVLS